MPSKSRALTGANLRKHEAGRDLADLAAELLVSVKQIKAGKAKSDRLASESAKLNPKLEKALAEEGMAGAQCHRHR